MIDTLRSANHLEPDTEIERVWPELYGSMDRLEGKLDKLTWMIGFSLAGTLGILVRLLLIE